MTPPEPVEGLQRPKTKRNRRHDFSLTSDLWVSLPPTERPRVCGRGNGRARCEAGGARGSGTGTSVDVICSAGGFLLLLDFSWAFVGDAGSSRVLVLFFSAEPLWGFGPMKTSSGTDRGRGLEKSCGRMSRDQQDGRDPDPRRRDFFTTEVPGGLDTSPGTGCRSESRLAVLGPIEVPREAENSREPVGGFISRREGSGGREGGGGREGCPITGRRDFFANYVGSQKSARVPRDRFFISLDGPRAG